MKRLNRARMIVGLDFEGDGDAVSNIHHPGVFLARADEDPGRLRGKGLEQRLGVFVTAMLAPHHRKHAQLGIGRLAAEDLFDVGVFFGSQIMLGNQFGRNDGFVHN
ncbi:MAG: hypothetical protein BWX84_02544 [Verrucomicrobia bacterium ADurb.Bin118]|nr:MAG: hypothetical protein BWX84_02544 [Verrucomicrobia bacterium ADurb.Bin118]